MKTNSDSPPKGKDELEKKGDFGIDSSGYPGGYCYFWSKSGRLPSARTLCVPVTLVLSGTAGS